MEKKSILSIGNGRRSTWLSIHCGWQVGQEMIRQCDYKLGKPYLLRKFTLTGCRIFFVRRSESCMLEFGAKIADEKQVLVQAFKSSNFLPAVNRLCRNEYFYG